MTHQVRRGGTWYRTLLSNGRSTYRSVWPSREYPDEFTGFRVVCLPPEVSTARCHLPLRGGSWGSGRLFLGLCRSAYRGRDRHGSASSYLGFRVVCLPPEVSTARCDLSVRGGSWNSNYFGLWSFSRGCDFSECTDSETGFRVVYLPREVAP